MRLVEQARDAAWMLAEYVAMNEGRLPSPWRGVVDRDGEVSVKMAAGTVTVSSDAMLRVANLLNGLQREMIFAKRQLKEAQDKLGTYVLKASRVIARLEKERDNLLSLVKQGKDECDSLRGQVEEWKRKYEAKVYHNE